MESLRIHLILIACCLATGLISAGCRSAAPIYVWSPPKLSTVVGAQIAIAPIAGDPKVAAPLHAAMLRQQPHDSGREVVALDARKLSDNQTIRQVSAVEGEASDIELMSLARRNQVDFILIGEVVTPASRQRTSPSMNHGTSRHQHDSSMVSGLDPNTFGENSATDSAADSHGLLRVSWSLIDVKNGLPLSGQPVVTPGDPSNPSASSIDQAAHAAWELVVPHVVRDQAELVAPRLSLGASAVRRGNELAAQGKWQQAEQTWQAVLLRHPRQHAAKHNLAVAAVARQDYSTARRCVAEALSQHSMPRYRDTAVWIEQRQRDYHTAFAIPDPPEGWAATRR